MKIPPSYKFLNDVRPVKLMTIFFWIEGGFGLQNLKCPAVPALLPSGLKRKYCRLRPAFHFKQGVFAGMLMVLNKVSVLSRRAFLLLSLNMIIFLFHSPVQFRSSLLAHSVNTSCSLIALVRVNVTR